MEMNECISGKGILFKEAYLQVRVDIGNREGPVLIDPYRLAVHQKM